MGRRIGRYMFTAVQPITLGEPIRFRVHEQPAHEIPLDRLIVNVPCPGFLTVHGIYVKGKNLLRKGPQDAITWHVTNGRNDFFDAIVTKEGGIDFDAEYTGLYPGSFERDQKYPVSFTCSEKTDDLYESDYP